jgi:hypothetical protein
MMNQLSYILLFLFLLSSCENRYRKGRVSTQAQASLNPQLVGKTNDDAYQVSQSEYNENFVSRYGLLYLMASQDPFTGRILTVNEGDSGEYVVSDESWKEGRKHGNCSKWFSNGIKMYERNYHEGRWNGSVTRWWPNGQKMYVRAYTNGVRHGKEATWRSDGTPLSLPVDGTPKVVELAPIKSEVEDDLPMIDLSESDRLPMTQEGTEELNLPAPAPLTDDDFIGIPGVPDNLNSEDSIDDFSGTPTLPTMEEDLPMLEKADVSLPLQPDSSEPDLILPGLEEPLTTEEPSLAELPSRDGEVLPSLPGVEGAGTSLNEELPALPGLLEEAGSENLPTLPGMDDSSGLPPLPSGDDGGFGDLPPLPPLP